jgi:hypothetical protein
MLVQRLSPDVEEVAQGGRDAVWGLDVDDTGRVVRMEPVQAQVLEVDAGVGRRAGNRFPIDQDGQMGMHVIRCSLRKVAADAVDRSAGDSRDDDAPRHHDNQDHQGQQQASHDPILKYELKELVVTLAG